MSGDNLKVYLFKTKHPELYRRYQAVRDIREFTALFYEVVEIEGYEDTLAFWFALKEERESQ